MVQPVDWEQAWLPLAVFSLMLALASDLGLTRSADYVSMVHLVILTALLAAGLVPALWVVTLGTALAGLFRQLLVRRTKVVNGFSPEVWHSTAATLGVNSISLCISGLIYQGIGGNCATFNWTWRDVLAMVTLCGSYFLVNQALDAWLLHARGKSISNYLQRQLWRIVALQLLPLPFAIPLARVYLGLDALTFVALCSSLIGLWKLSQRLGETHQDLEKRLRELRALNKIGQAIATSSELDLLFNTLYHQVSQLMEVDCFYIALCDAATDELTFPVVFEGGERQRYAARRASDDLAGYVIRQRKPILIPELAVEIIANLGLKTTGQPPLSWLGVPLSVGDKVLGVVTVQSFSRPRAFDQADMALLSTLAAQAAIALENAQLYGQMEQRTAELALLNTVSTAVNSTLDLDLVSQIVVTSVTPIMACQKSALYLLDSIDGELKLSATHGLSDEFKNLAVHSDFSAQWLHTPNMFVASDVNASDLSAAQVELALREGYRAFAKAPLLAQNELIGVLTVYYDQVHYFDLAERDLLTTYANQCATAIANARLYSHTDQELAQRVQELSVIERVGRELAALLDPQRVLDLVLEQAISATGATRGCIAMLEESSTPVNIAARRGYATKAAQEFLAELKSSGKGVIGRVLSSGQLALVRDVHQDRSYVSVDPSIRSQLTVPILRKGATLGAINLESDQINGFDDQVANFVSQLATQAAIALQNAQLFQERGQRVEELSLLYQASLALASSLDYQDVLNIISRLARHITNSDTVTFYLYDSITDQFERASTQGYRANETGSSTIRKEGIAHTITETGRPVLISDTITYPNINPIVIERGIRSIIGVPVMNRGKVLGALFVNHRQTYAYTENDVQLVSALASQAGATIGNVSLFRQVSEARDRLEAIINSTQEGILVLDNSGRVVIANVHMEAFSNLRRDQLVGHTVDELLASHQEELMNLLGLTQEKLHEWAHSLQNKPTGSSTRSFQIPAFGGVSTSQKRSQSRFTELFGTPVLDETEQVIGRLMVFRDITEEKELEMMREDLTSMMVHDLRSPLASVLSGLEMMKELEINENSDPLTVQAMQISERSCQNMLTLVNSLLDINQLEAGKMPLERAPAPFPPLARSVVSRLSPLAAENDLTVHTELSPDLPLVVIDNEKIGRVLNNLLDNALKFAPAGGTVVIRAVHQKDELGNHLLCSVSDTGPGIPKEYHEKIFGRFAQVRGQAAPRGRRGSGLGLAFCKLAIEAHDGRIWVESEPGQGSIFYFTLPVADIEAWLGE